MLKFPSWKILLILMPCLWGIYSFSPHFFYSQVEKYNDLKKSGLVETQKPLLEPQLWYDWVPSDLVNLGLDLRGGAHVLVEVSLEDVYSERIQNFWPEIRKNLRAIRNEVGSFSQEVSALNDSLIITISKKEGIEKAVSFLNKELSSKKNILEILRFEDNKIKVSFVEQEKRKIDNQTMDHLPLKIKKSKLEVTNHN